MSRINVIQESATTSNITEDYRIIASGHTKERNKTYHFAGCPIAKNIKEKYKIELANPNNARQAGFKPCPQCNRPESDMGPSRSCARCGCTLSVYNMDIICRPCKGRQIY